MFKIIPTIALAVTLTACGGSGGGGPSEPSVTNPTWISATEVGMYCKSIDGLSCMGGAATLHEPITFDNATYKKQMIGKDTVTLYNGIESEWVSFRSLYSSTIRTITRHREDSLGMNILTRSSLAQNSIHIQTPTYIYLYCEPYSNDPAFSDTVECNDDYEGYVGNIPFELFTEMMDTENTRVDYTYELAKHLPIL